MREATFICSAKTDQPADRPDEPDHVAFSALYDRHAPLVYGIAKRILGDQQAAEDVTQSVFLLIWSRPHVYAGGNFAAWIARVARNASIDVLRSAAVRTRSPESEHELPDSYCLDEQVVHSLNAEALRSAIAQLPDHYRAPIQHAYFAGLTYREVAQRLGAPLGTVKSRIRTGLRRLSEALLSGAILSSTVRSEAD